MQSNNTDIRDLGNRDLFQIILSGTRELGQMFTQRCYVPKRWRLLIILFLKQYIESYSKFYKMLLVALAKVFLSMWYWCN